MTWDQWMQALLIVAGIALVTSLFGILIWRLAKKDEQERRDREEGPTTQALSKYEGQAH